METGRLKENKLTCSPQLSPQLHGRQIKLYENQAIVTRTLYNIITYDDGEIQVQGVVSFIYGHQSVVEQQKCLSTYSWILQTPTCKAHSQISWAPRMGTQILEKLYGKKLK